MAKKKKNRPQEVWNYRTMFGPGLNFAASEAYKLLRTNIMFSFPEEGRCHIVGVTSSVQDEGKSSTTSNLAYALSETGKKVLLFGDISYYWIADRTNRTLKRLNELYAVNDQVGFIGTQRVDGKLILPEAMQVLALGTGTASSGSGSGT